jgi:hypothetical protein
MNNLGIIWMARNSLTGELPPCLFDSLRLSSIDLSGNRLEGTMPVVTSSMLWELVPLARTHARTHL